jgi:acyl carrier protein
MKIEEYLSKFTNKNYDLPLKEFFLTEEALNKGITVEEEIKHQESTFDGFLLDVDFTIIMFLMDIENTFNIKFIDYEVENINSINDLIENVSFKIKNNIV